MKYQGNMSPTEEHNNFPVMDPKVEICDLSDKELKTVILKMFSELKRNLARQFNNIRIIIHEKMISLTET